MCRSTRQTRAAGAIHVGYSALTGYPLGVVKAMPYGDYHGDVDAVRQADAEDPRRTIHNGAPAVRAAGAAA